MRSRRTSFLALGCLLVAMPAAAGSDGGLDALMQSMAARPHGHAAFTESQYLAVLKTRLESAGDLYFRYPDHLEKLTRTPTRESLVVDSGTLTVTRGRLHHTLSLTAYPQLAAFIDSIRATLAGDRAALERTFTLQFAAEGSRWTLSLTPRDPKLAMLVRQIRIEGSADAISTVETLRADGDRSVMVITPVPDG
jgi:hypothetical protein